MRRYAPFVVAGLVLGAATAVTVDRVPVEPDGGGAPTSTSTTPAPVAEPVESKPLPADEGLALVWTPDRLTSGIGPALAALDSVTHVIRVDAGMVGVTRTMDARGVVVDQAPSGWSFPVEVLSYAPADLRFLAPEVEVPGPGEVVLGATSASVRMVGVGGTIETATGAVLSVVDVAPDELVGAAELVMTHGSEPVPTEPRALVVAFSGDREQVRAVALEAAGDVPVRFRGPGETPYLRHGDAVAPPALVKDRFGEFAVGPGFQVDVRWVEDNLITTDLPLVGRVTCHRAVVGMLRAAFERIAESDPGSIDPGRFEGCWSPRPIAGSDVPSRHAWGIAVDVNYQPDNPIAADTVDATVVDAFRAVGFTWGGEWLTPDPTHFEWVGWD